MEKKKIILANTVDAWEKALMRSANTEAGQEMIRHTVALAMRGFFWEGDDKVVITPYLLPPELRDHIMKAATWTNVDNWSPKDLGIDLSQAITSDLELWMKLVRLIEDNKDISLTAYGITPQLIDLYQRLRAEGLEFNVTENCSNTDLVYYLDSKVGFRETIEGIVEIPAGHICRTQEEVETWVEKYLRSGQFCVIKANKGGSGWGTLILNPEHLHKIGSVREYIEQVFHDDNIWSQGPFVVEECVDVDFSVAGGSPSIEVYVTESGPIWTYNCEQVISDDGEFLGVGIGVNAVPEELGRRQKENALKIGWKYFELGYRGFFDVDSVVDKAGNLYAVETNIRRTGGTHVFDLGRSIWGEDQAKWGYLLSEDAFFYGKELLDANEILTKAAGLLFPSSTHEGVVISLISVTDPVLGYIVVANTRERALEIQKMFREIWQ